MSIQRRTQTHCTRGIRASEIICSTLKSGRTPYAALGVPTTSTVRAVRIMKAQAAAHIRDEPSEALAGSKLRKMGSPVTGDRCASLVAEASGYFDRVIAALESSDNHSVSTNRSYSDELQSAYLSGQRAFEQELKNNLSHADFAGMNLSHADLSQAVLDHANLQRCDLSHADLSDASLQGANLSHADLSNVDFKGANLCGANLRGANLNEADFSYSDLSDADLGDVSIDQTYLNGTLLYKTKITKVVQQIAGQKGARFAPRSLLINILGGGGEKQGRPIPVNYRIPLYFATNRNLNNKTISEFIRKKNPFKPHFGAELNFGYVEVSNPWNLISNNNDLPKWWFSTLPEDFSKEPKVEDIKKLSEKRFLNKLKISLSESSTKDILLFIHGFNTRFQDAVIAAVRLYSDLKFPGLPMLFSWPSWGKTELYVADEQNAESAMTRDSLRDFLKLLIEDKNTGKVHVIAHSMGNRPLVKYFETPIAAINIRRKRNCALRVPLLR